MKRQMLAISGALLLVGGCVSAPRSTVSHLDRKDPQWSRSECVAARQAAARYDDQKDGRAAIAVAGNLLVPFAGTAASLAMNKVRDERRAAVNERLRAACISDPLGARRVARR